MRHNLRNRGTRLSRNQQHAASTKGSITGPASGQCLNVFKLIQAIISARILSASNTNLDHLNKLNRKGKLLEMQPITCVKLYSSIM